MATMKTLTPPKEGERIEARGGRLQVPDTPIIPYIEGDGTGPDIWRATVRVLDAAVRKVYGSKRRIVWFEVFAGEKAHARFGTWLPDETLQMFEHYIVGIKGPLTTPVGGGFRSLNVRSEEHTSELQSPCNLVCRLLLEKKKKNKINKTQSKY